MSEWPVEFRQFESEFKRLRSQFDDFATKIIASYRDIVGGELLPGLKLSDDPVEALFYSEKIIVAHGTEADPVFHFGSARALLLWELPLEKFLGMPSRLTAEPMHRDERERLLQRTLQFGFVDDYQGVRISSTGRRFWIERATIWNLTVENVRYGQAACFDTYKRLDLTSES